MPKKTMAQKLRNKTKMMGSSQTLATAVVQNEFLVVDPMFKKDLLKSIVFAVLITAFEIGLYFIYYLRVFERR
ncbi:MAG: hypothetical protein NTZ55_03210 [Candidatus Roizmanbacteria bacterium]|nr:hypothetical protein [Candidatus Roizmanbacteria bacterium]